ncbi:response regulator [Undibacterium sp. Ji50W]|uniref:response regulator n=1 Tax=Undibacterium sp. Ji50W TaxID=3413041 RepID=UPI003BF37482
MLAHILIIDDHALFRSGLSMLLRQNLRIPILEAASLEETLRKARSEPDQTAPCLVLLDILLQGLNGIDGISLLKRRWPHTPIVMLSSDAMQKTVKLALACGATAFLSKGDTSEHMLALIGQVLNGEAVSPETPRITQIAAPRLTPRQTEVLDLLCQGMPNKVIARQLLLSENTVRVHVQAVLASLQVSNRSEAIVAARRLGMVG